MLPYGVKVQFENKIYDVEYVCPMYGEIKLDYLGNYTLPISDIKPYLRSMNDMTEEEWADYQKIRMIDWVNGDINGTFINAGLIVDWLNRHHFDYHYSYDKKDGRWKTMIEKGLAIAVTKENNPYK